ncbi:MAG: SpoIID/LytB domain-containing protein [Ignavibacteriales bacterium]|nr:SpoIID/LytB domain-containing protein [Ignavibacteriales bacterium]
MIKEEPNIHVGVVEHAAEIRGVLNGSFELPTTIHLEGSFTARCVDRRIVLFDHEGVEVMKGNDIAFRPLRNGTFTLNGVTIGISFHWERKEDQTFEGSLRLLAAPDGTITAINELSVEAYLRSVISSEMSAEAPLELLKAHAITSRSWLVAMLDRQKRGKNVHTPALRSRESDSELVRWYDREDHTAFDVCADDHCQRYQGITKIISAQAREAIDSTRGSFLLHEDEICDARYYKACGGLTELFENAWEDTSVPYLQSVSDGERLYPAVVTEDQAREWILSSPDAYCNTTDGEILRQILPSFDQETTDFFRWKVEYSREELERIVEKKSGIDFGTIMDLVPLRRGPSGRIIRLKIVGSKRSIIVGKELEIRRWLSNSHLYSSAFVAELERDGSGVPSRIVLRGAGWGHGVGLCQIGASVMAARGKKAEEIVLHYFPGARLQKLY